MDAVARYQLAERLLTEALDLHKLKQKANPNDYDAVRKVRQRGEKIWADVAAHLTLVSRGDTLTQEDHDAAATTAPRTGRRRKPAEAPREGG